MIQSYFSLGFLSQNSIWKLSLNRGYKGIYILRWEGMWKVSFSQTGCSGDLTSRLGWVVGSSREQTAWPAWDFCPIVQQLARLFSFWHAWHVSIIMATCSHEPPARSSCKSLFLCIILNNSSHSLTHYPYMIPSTYTPTWEGCWLQSSSIDQHDEDHAAPWLQNPIV